MRRSFRTLRFCTYLSPGFHPGLVCAAPLGQKVVVWTYPQNPPPTAHRPPPMVHGSWFMVHGSWFMVHGSWFMVQAFMVQAFMVQAFNECSLACIRGAPKGHCIPAQGVTLGLGHPNFWRSEGTLHTTEWPRPALALCGVPSERSDFAPIYPQGSTLGWYAQPRWGRGLSSGLHSEPPQRGRGWCCGLICCHSLGNLRVALRAAVWRDGPERRPGEMVPRDSLEGLTPTLRPRCKPYFELGPRLPH